MDIGWTDERVDALKKLWGDGLSASQIAAEMGGGLTRNAVISKVHRIGLSGRAKGHDDGRSQKARKARNGGVQSARRSYRKKITEAALAGESPQFETDGTTDNLDEFDLNIPAGQRCALLDLTEDTCRWPVGDPLSPDFFFCGGKSVPGVPYCAYHSRIAYQAPAVRHDRRPPQNR